MATRLHDLHSTSLEDPETFWAEAAEAVSWSRRWTTVLDRSRAPHFHRWFVGARCNTCYNALDRHVEGGRGEQAALIYDSPLTGQQRTYSYRELRDEVARCAGLLRSLGVERGDRVIIYMPMVPETAVAMLACARLGAVHSVVFGGFAAQELATRIRDARPTVMITASCGIEPNRVVPYQPMVQRALTEAAGIVQRVVVLARDAAPWALDEECDVDWHAGMAQAEPADCVQLEATDPLYILYTSGTTGEPKGIVRDNGGHMVALAWSMKHVYGVEPGEVYWAASDVGWVVGHSYIVYGPLLQGCTTVLYEGKPVGTPDAGAFFRVIAEHGVTTLFTAPTAFRAIRRVDPTGALIRAHPMPTLRALFLAGERCDPDTLHWAEEQLGVPVIDHWWQTETGWSIAANCLGIELLPVKPGSPATPVPGYDVRVLGEDHEEVPRGTIGDICVRLPLPPSCLPTLWQADDRYVESYLTAHPGHYTTGDAGYMDDDGYLFVMSRIDDVINVAGHRLSTGAMEEVLASQPDVAECAVIGVKDALKGQLPLGLLVLNAATDTTHDEVVADVIARVRASIGAVAAFKTAVVVARLPKTRSGKILRRTMAAIANGEAFEVPATIDDPAILDEITLALRGIGYPPGPQQP
ncbi:MAG: propionyl-CoA synthetase [Myxococcales bacterium]|nr:propionyl-CoA synthetase [Myxococcales bacterium]